MTKLLSCLFVAAAISTVYLPIASRADDLTTGTGNELITECNQNNYAEHTEAWTYCMGYVDGVISGFNYVKKDIVKPQPNDNYPATTRVVLGELYVALKSLYCKPDNSTRAQGALVVSKYLSDNPSELNQSARSLVIDAFMQAWPCPKTGK